MNKPLFLASMVLASVAATYAGTITSSKHNADGTTSYSFIPGDADLADLDHHNATTWDITWNLPAGVEIIGATLSIKNIRDWEVETNDALFIHLLDNPKKTTSGLTVVVDDKTTNQTQIKDYFKDQGTYIDTWSDPRTTMDAYKKDSRGRYILDSKGNKISTNLDYTHTFTDLELDALGYYITNPNAPVMKQVWVAATGSKKRGTYVDGHYESVVDYIPADFGFGFDPDCHYYNDGVCFTIVTRPVSVPEAGSLLLSLGSVLAAMIAVKRRIQR